MTDHQLTIACLISVVVVAIGVVLYIRGKLKILKEDLYDDTPDPSWHDQNAEPVWKTHKKLTRTTVYNSPRRRKKLP